MPWGDSTPNNKKLNNWTFESLNLAGRLVIVKYVLQDMPLYLFSTLDTLESVLRNICNIQRNFLWWGSEEKRKWALVRWDKLYTPIFFGGLGL